MERWRGCAFETKRRAVEGAEAVVSRIACGSRGCDSQSGSRVARFIEHSSSFFVTSFRQGRVPESSLQQRQ